MVTGPSRVSLAIGAIAFAAMAAGAALIAFDSSRTLIGQWRSSIVTVGAGAVFALPFIAIFLLALAVATARSLPDRRRPSERMGRWTWATGAIALASILAAIIGSSMIAEALEARGYHACTNGSPLRLGVVHWRQEGLPCAT